MPKSRVSFIAVLGVGRCGSSAVAGMLQKGGVPIGRDLIGPHERFNARGHFEDREWHRLNRLIAHQCCPDEIQAAIRNETVDRYPEFAVQEWYPNTLSSLYRKTIAEFEQPVWGMKCIMLGLIWPYVCTYFGDDVRMIVVQRDREDVIRSRMEHSQLSRAEAERLIDALQEGIDKALKMRTQPYLLLEYENLVSSGDAKYTAKLLGLFTGLDTFDVDAAAAHIDPSLNHARERMAAI